MSEGREFDFGTLAEALGGGFHESELGILIRLSAPGAGKQGSCAVFVLELLAPGVAPATIGRRPADCIKWWRSSTMRRLIKRVIIRADVDLTGYQMLTVDRMGDVTKRPRSQAA